MSASTTSGAIAPVPRCCTLRGAPLGGPYCAQCGQADPRRGRPLREVMLGPTGTLLHTLRMLLMPRRIHADSWPAAAAKAAFARAVGAISDTALAYGALALSLLTV